jgi:hypothetical protein
MLAFLAGLVVGLVVGVIALAAYIGSALLP